MSVTQQRGRLPSPGSAVLRTSPEPVTEASQLNPASPPSSLLHLSDDPGTFPEELSALSLRASFRRLMNRWSRLVACVYLSFVMSVLIRG